MFWCSTSSNKRWPLLWLSLLLLFSAAMYGVQHWLCTIVPHHNAYACVPTKQFSFDVMIHYANLPESFFILSILLLLLPFVHIILVFLSILFFVRSCFESRNRVYYFRLRLNTFHIFSIGVCMCVFVLLFLISCGSKRMRLRFQERCHSHGCIKSDFSYKTWELDEMKWK